jgi:hypothetical protein
MLALALLAVAAAPASASSVSLDLAGTRTLLGQSSDGTLLYRAVYGRHLSLTGRALDDHGSPVAAGTIIHLTMRTHPGDTPKAVADVSADATGRFSYGLVPDHGRLYDAHVDAATGVTAADANHVRLYVAPSIRLTSHLNQVGKRYRISGKISIPSPQTAGRIRLLRCSSVYTHCKLVVSVHLHANGTWKTSVVHHSRGIRYYLIQFAPADALVWASSQLQLAVVFR